ncbi:MAG TPA: cbb3-type cytochrome c oxidase subunit 3 [Thiobacillaceae bacterium]|nr:cbb3-type cytochrome c oxidase subunit 3 [Thiobacillaceae bacterium]
MDGLNWFSKPENTKPLVLIIFFVIFVGILYYVFGSKRRSERLESYRQIPFMDDDEDEEEEKQ